MGGIRDYSCKNACGVKWTGKRQKDDRGGRLFLN